MKKIVGSALAVVILAGCQTTTPPPAKKPISEMTRCELVGELLSNPWATPGQQAAAMEMGRNDGCFGRPQTRNYDVTIRTGQ